MNIGQITDAVKAGNVQETKRLVKKALVQGASIQTILDALIDAMSSIGELFKKSKIFVPEMILSARAMSVGIQILEPLMMKSDAKMVGVAVIGTIKGDLHEIGKNLVALMLRSIGVTVYDLGIDVSPEQFLEKVEEVNADIVAISSLLTSTMASIPDVLELFKKKAMRDKVYFIVGGAPISQRYVNEIGADGYAMNATMAASVIKAHLQAKYGFYGKE